MGKPAVNRVKNGLRGGLSRDGGPAQPICYATMDRSARKTSTQRDQRKILTRAELMRRRSSARDNARVVAHCHGCFDIVHPGHVRHLQHAARQGDVLIVTITADAVMNKGEGRPLFPQELRAESLAALDCVDWVCINTDATADAILEDLRPDIYIKGREYESNDDPRFAAEREAVERHGGRVIFTSGDIVFSSTALISEMEHREDPSHARLRQLHLAHDLSRERMDELIDGFAGQRVLVVGETIIDTYVMCDRPEVTGEGPMMSLRPLEQISYDGGAAIIAQHLAAMGARPISRHRPPPIIAGRSAARTPQHQRH